MLMVIIAMFAGDAVLASLHGCQVLSPVTPFVYGGFTIRALLGYRLRAKRGGAVVAAALGSVAFFLLSSFGVWMSGTIYPPTPTGFLACCVAALPFFGAPPAGDISGLQPSASPTWQSRDG